MNSEGLGVKFSCMVEITSLCDTMISNKEEILDRGDFIQFMLSWVEMRKNNRC